MDVLLIGSGGRESALAWKLGKSSSVKRLLVAPGSDGIGRYPKTKCFSIKADDILGLLRLAQEEGVDFTIVGPEKPLMEGIVDAFTAAGKRIFGPTAKAAHFTEGSKADCKLLLEECGIPIPRFEIFDNPEDAKMFVEERGVPIVIKPDGLTGGKGVVVVRDMSTALDAIDRIMPTPAGKRIVVEEFLDGEECSYIVLTDGEHIFPLPPARDYKQTERGMTGGMVSYSPVPDLTPDLEGKIIWKIFKPFLRGLAERGYSFRGALYAGVMITPNGIYVLEFNCRFGDPETQVMLPRFPDDLDLLPLLLATTDGTLVEDKVEYQENAAVSIALAAEGYPGEPRVGDKITGIEEVEKMENVLPFHAGTQKLSNGEWITYGGRVLHVAGMGLTVPEAAQTAYRAVDHIKFPGKWFLKKEEIGV